MHIRSKDTVVVITGKDKGKEGKVLVASPKTGKVVVEGVAIATKHQKPRQQGVPGGIVKKEAAIDASNVMLVCPKCKKGVRVGYKNVNQIPKIDKIVINMGLGDCKDNPKALEAAVKELEAIAGQKAITTKAKKSIANFKLREGMNIGAKVTLRGERMYEFMDKLMNIALPRVRDFHGVSDKAFDGRGNYALGIREQLLFPEIDYDKVEKVRGMEMIFVTTAQSDEECKELLRLMGMPFTK